ncbi:hypothetical protein [Planctomicrobium piriforme]|uniref:Dolichyl-phosphate-mannose-protein mannosyltransferase n=1 Tax=Planctomicrobium piriforme TaxID=1576369 RepID=A0A1I3BGS2_9PLAN|nr:hypothetical protein [Planctomicrobium piriforme]SFH61472.1 hypothetical protein SAMN05421753_101446 [Planctomicrobium piriforme]
MSAPANVELAPASPLNVVAPWKSACATWRESAVLPVVGLVLSIAVVYFPVVQFQLLNWDDSWYLTWNELIKSWAPGNLYRIATEPVARNYAPLTILSFLTEHTLWGLRPAGYHVTNVLLHMLNAVLVFRLLRQLTKNDWLSWGVAMLFALHPVQVESVAWISSRKTLLSSTFMLASFMCWLRPERTAKQEGWGLLWLLLGLLSKASTVVVPPIVVAYDVLVARKKLSDAIARQAVPMFFCIMLILTTMNAQVTIIGGLRSHIGMSKLQLLGVDLTLLWRYVGMLLWPSGLCVLYDPPTNGISGLIAASALGWAVVAWGLWAVRKRCPEVTLAGVSAILLLVPVLNLFPLTTLMNDRYLYLPCVPFFAVIGWLLQQGWNRLQTALPSIRFGYEPAAALVTTLAVGAAAWGTLTYLPAWRDPVSLWNYARVQTPSLTTMHVQWALTMEDEGKPNEAVAALHYALEHCQPDELDRERIQVILDRVTGVTPPLADPTGPR